jgi:hypothetical protein
MKEVNYKINIETKSSSKGIKKVNKELDDIPKGIKKAEKGTEDLNKGLKGTGKVAGAVKGAFQKMGVALKSVGIGFIIAAVAKLTQLLMTNQKVMDAFNVVGEATAIIFNDVFNAISGTVETLSKTNDSFNAVGKIISSFITISLTPLKLGFQVLKGYVIGVQLAYQELMGAFGASNEKEIKELKESLLETGEAFLQVGKDVGSAYVDIYDNVVEATGEVVDFTATAIEEISKIDVKSSLARAAANIELAKAAEIARVTQQALVEQYDREAEKLRQIRDDERISIAERIKANDDLKAVLDEQEEAMLKQVDLQIRAAKTQYDINGSQENYIALLEAQTEKTAVLAQIEGFRSEQMTNASGLAKEQLELQLSITDAVAERTIAERDAAAELIKSDEKRLLKQLENLEKEKEIEQQRLELKRDSYNADTQAYVDSQIELENFISESNIRKAALDDELTQAEIQNGVDIAKIEDEELKRKFELAKQSAAAIQLLGDAVYAHKLKNVKQGSEEEEAILKKQFNFNKAMSIAQTILNTAGAIVAATNPGAGGLGIPAGLPGAILAGVTGIAQLGIIASTKFGGGNVTTPDLPSASTLGTGTGTGIGSQAPAFNVVGQSGFNQVASAIGQNNDTPIQAYVVSGDITTAQNLDNNIIQTATF